MSTKDENTQEAPQKAPYQLSDEERERLLALARDSLLAALARQSLPVLDEDVLTPQLAEDSAAFVSLYRGDELRGCIGTFSRSEPLWRVIQRMTLMAASEDPRFTPIQPNEGDAISFELSVLTRPEPITGPDDVVIGRDGLVISDTTHRGVLLPQVATKRDWDAETFLSYTCRKAGLPPDAWKKPSTTIERFQAVVFQGP